tara:strand:+ start:4659 stop:5543 length:885 start_codon:yes stop_codon:yes gene_type:complete
MKYYRIEKNNKKCLIVNYKNDLGFNITQYASNIDNIEILYTEALNLQLTRTEYINKFIDEHNPDFQNLKEMLDKEDLLTPFLPEEVWAAGVTYKNSEFERKRESSTPDIYSKVYNSDRPEIFFKTTGKRLVNPGESVGIRSDSDWNVPEAELAVMLINNTVIGYSIGNDMTSRHIEGENPLYLTQAKIYDKSCSIGPCVIDIESVKNINNYKIACDIQRKNKVIFEGSSKINLMNKSIENLISWLQKSNTLPLKSAFLTGTGIVPPPEFTLKPNDIVNISIDEIGTLSNKIVSV